MSKRDLGLMQRRVQSRLADLDMSPAEAARRGGLAKDFLYDLLNGRKKSVRSDSIWKLARALDCDWQYLEGEQDYISVGDNIVDFDRPPIQIIGEVAPGVYVEKDHTYSGARMAPDMPTLPPDTRFPVDAQVDFYIRGNSLNRFAPSGFILRCILYDKWTEVIRDGDLLVVDRFKDGLRERAAWRISPTESYIEFSTDTTDKREHISWRAAVDPRNVASVNSDKPNALKSLLHSDYQPFAVAIFAYAEPRLRRMF